MPRERMTIAEYHAALRGQGVSGREHAATVCPICGTVQSIASLRAAGVPEETAEKVIGFSCIGRFTNAGPVDTRKGRRKGDQLGCDWTLGGLLRLHDLDVVFEDGTTQPAFRPAGAEEARALEKRLAVEVGS